MKIDRAAKLRILLFLILPIIGVFAWYALPWPEHAILMKYGRQGEGRVLDKEIVKKEQQDSAHTVIWEYYADFEYAPGPGTPLRGRQKVSREEYERVQKGQSIALHYLAERPSIVMWDEDFGVEGTDGIALVFAAFFFVMLFALVAFLIGKAKEPAISRNS